MSVNEVGELAASKMSKGAPEGTVRSKISQGGTDEGGGGSSGPPMGGCILISTMKARYFLYQIDTQHYHLPMS